MKFTKFNVAVNAMDFDANLFISIFSHGTKSLAQWMGSRQWVVYAFCGSTMNTPFQRADGSCRSLPASASISVYKLYILAYMCNYNYLVCANGACVCTRGVCVRMQMSPMRLPLLCRLHQNAKDVHFNSLVHEFWAESHKDVRKESYIWKYAT